jgi:DNA-binding transcriptional regulator YiaG
MTSPFTELPDVNCRVFHSEEVENDGLPADPGWYWEWNENGTWLGPFGDKDAAIADALGSRAPKSATAHPNRNKREAGPGANPDPAVIRDARKAAGLTQTQAGALIYCTLRAWQQWEDGSRRMHPAFWDLWRRKLGER